MRRTPGFKTRPSTYSIGLAPTGAMRGGEEGEQGVLEGRRSLFQDCVPRGGSRGIHKQEIPRPYEYEYCHCRCFPTPVMGGTPGAASPAKSPLRASGWWECLITLFAISLCCPELDKAGRRRFPTLHKPAATTVRVMDDELLGNEEIVRAQVQWRRRRTEHQLEKEELSRRLSLVHES